MFVAKKAINWLYTDPTLNLAKVWRPVPESYHINKFHFSFNRDYSMENLLPLLEVLLGHPRNLRYSITS